LNRREALPPLRVWDPQHPQNSTICLSWEPSGIGNRNAEGFSAEPGHRGSYKPSTNALNKFSVAQRRPNCWLADSPVNTESPALAVIDGTLCQLTREGARATGHIPLATAVVEFRHGPLCYYVREHPYGLLPGLPNLYCLDANFRLKWMAEWPDASDPCVAIADEENNQLVAVAASGAIVRLDPQTGRLQGIDHPLATAI
jgi:hypothetical protein